MSSFHMALKARGTRRAPMARHPARERNLARKPDDLRSRMTSGRDARRKPPRGTATPPLHLRRTAGGLPAAAPGTGPRQLPAVTFGLAELRSGGAILPSATILKPGKITGEGAARHT